MMIVSSQPPDVEICDTDGGIVIKYFGGTPVGSTVTDNPEGDTSPKTVEIIMAPDGKDPRFDLRIKKALQKEQLILN